MNAPQIRCRAVAYFLSFTQHFQAPCSGRQAYSHDINASSCLNSESNNSLGCSPDAEIPAPTIARYTTTGLAQWRSSAADAREPDVMTNKHCQKPSMLPKVPKCLTRAEAPRRRAALQETHLGHLNHESSARDFDITCI
jgi:hypothetical protein